MENSSNIEDFENVSCCCLKRTFFVRKWFIHLVHWPWFERLSMLVILVSCICLALTDPLDNTCAKIHCQRLEKVNMFVLWFFVAEMVIKMIAMGIIGKKAYFAEGWNKLDFLIVVAGIVDEFSGPQGAFLMIIRLVRVLRPLRAINRVPSIRILVTLLLEALPLLGNVFTLAFLVLFIFGIIGVQLWQGVLRNRCFLNTSLLDIDYTYNNSLTCYHQMSFDQPDFLCSLPRNNGMQSCGDMSLTSSCWSKQLNMNQCFNESLSRHYNRSLFSCIQEGPNPFHDILSFDNIGYAWMAIFQIITLEGWSEIMYLIQEAYSYWVWVYFVVLILIGPFFLVNLCLVVLTMQFQETKTRELQLLEEDRRRKSEADKVFKDTRWARAMSVVKNNISESLHKPNEKHIHHHHHHIHHYYHHNHVMSPVLPTPTPSRIMVTQGATTGSFHVPQEPNDTILSLEVTSNCKISQNFISTIDNIQTDTISISSDQPHSLQQLQRTNSTTSVEASTSAIVLVNVSNTRKCDEESIPSNTDSAATTTAAFTTVTEDIRGASQRKSATEATESNTRKCDEESIPSHTDSAAATTTAVLTTVTEDICGASEGKTDTETTEKRAKKELRSETQVATTTQASRDHCENEEATSKTTTTVAASATIKEDTRTNSFKENVNDTNNIYKEEATSKSTATVAASAIVTDINEDVVGPYKKQTNEQMTTKPDVTTTTITTASASVMNSEKDACGNSKRKREEDERNEIFELKSKSEITTKNTTTKATADALVSIKKSLEEVGYICDNSQKKSVIKDTRQVSNDSTLKSDVITTTSGETDDVLIIKKTLEIPTDATAVNVNTMKDLPKTLNIKKTMKESTSVAAKTDALSTSTMNSIKDHNVSSGRQNGVGTKEMLEPSLTKFAKLDITQLKTDKAVASHCNTELHTSLSVPSSQRERQGSGSSLDDKFGSLFDIKRFATYNVSHDMTLWEKFRHKCGQIANSSSFTSVIMLVIICNTIIMATEHYQQSEFLDALLEISNFFFITIFFLEMLIKIVGEGISVYISQWFNIFDAFIVIISIIEVIILQGNGGLSVLRSIRLLRIFRLIRPIRYQLIVMIHTMASVVTFTALLLLFMFTFAVLGMNLFGGKMQLPNSQCQLEKTRSNFDTFFSAMITIFQLLTLEDWNIVMHNAMRSTTHWAAVYFIILTIIGYYVLLNLLVAILVEGFTNPFLYEDNCEDDEDSEVNIEPTKSSTDWLEIIKSAREKSSLEKSKELSDTSEEATSSYCGPAMRGVIGQPRYNNQKNTRNNEFAAISITDTMTVPKSTSIEMKKVRKMRRLAAQRTNTPDNVMAYSNNGYSNSSLVKTNTFIKPEIIVSSFDDLNEIGKTASLDDIYDTDTTEFDEKKTEKLSFFTRNESKSLFLFSEENRFRCLMMRISSSSSFDYFILFLIVVSCIFIVLDHPNITTERKNMVQIASIVFTVLFTIEVVIKVIAQGFLIGSDSYFRRGWNVLDFVIVLISWLHIIVTASNSNSPAVLGSVKVIRGLRTLRPLRMIRRTPGLKLVVESLLHSLKPIGNTVLIAAIFFVVFGILGVQLFKGSFHHCDGDTSVKTKQECLEKGRGQWVNRPYNFDNLPKALVTLFVLATRDGWVTVMHHGLDAVRIDWQPQRNYNEWRVFYFVGFLMAVGFLVLNMVVGIVVNNYQLCQEKQERKIRKNKKEEKPGSDLEIIDKTRNVPLEELLYQSIFRQRCFRLCKNKYWDVFIAVVICLNVSLMALEHYKMSSEYETFLDVNNYVCTTIFVVEVLIKLSAFGCRAYFIDRWNILDFLVVVFSIFGIVMDLIHHTVRLALKPTVIRGLRVLRIIRVFKLFKVAKGVRSLLDTIMNSLPQVGNLGILLFLIFFIYSSLGIHLFGSIECSTETPCNGLDSHANFRDFQTAMLTLFRVATGDNWNTIYMDTVRSKCDASTLCQRNCCYSKYLAPLYFITFVLTTHFVVLNVLVAVLMKDLKASRDRISAVLSRRSFDQRVLKFTLSATKFMKEKAFPSKKQSTVKEEFEVTASGPA